MTVALLILLNLQLTVVIAFCLSERRGATRYRDEALELIGGRLDVDLLTWARTVRRKRPVVAVLGNDQQEHRKANGAEVSHDSSVTSGADAS